MEKVYYIYHIPNYVNKGKKWEGILGKIGVTDNLKRRTSAYKYKYELLEMETHTCIYKVSDREQELQRQYGYPVDKIQYWKRVEETQRPQTRDKMSKNNAKFWKDKTFTSEHRVKIAESNKGKTHSEESRDKMSKFQTGKITSEQTRAKMSESREKHTVNQYSKDGTFIAQYPSLKEAYRKTGVDFGSIRHCCRGHYKTSGGYIWKYAD
jgi:hypothetical protein